VTPNVEKLKSDFARFIEERQQPSGRPPLSQKEKDQLFDQFKDWSPRVQDYGRGSRRTEMGRMEGSRSLRCVSAST
jgi:hypothetical protein